MEKPDIPLAQERYRLIWLNGRKSGQKVVLTIDGDRWELDNGATLADVTHLPCRSARYTPLDESSSPRDANQFDFPVTPGAEMPNVKGHSKVDYAVLFVDGLE